MIKKTVFCVALASLMLATSCNQEDLQQGKYSSKEISPNVSMGLKTTGSRATETTISNLGSFTMSAFKYGEANYMNAIEYTSNEGNMWSTSAGKFYWPQEGDLYFYAYAPVVPGLGGSYSINKDCQKLNAFTPNSTAATQKDFIYAKSKGNAKQNGSTGVDLDFQHGLSEITISARNANAAYTVEVSGVKIGNVINKGSFTFPSLSGSAASWALSQDVADKANYSTTWNNPVKLGSNASNLDDNNVPFMLIPQQLIKSSKVTDNSYIALKVKITMQGGAVVYNDWAYVGIDTNWEMGTKYVYMLDFTDGVGQKEDGTLILSNKEITANVTITPWNDQSEDVDYSASQNIFTGMFADNCVLLDLAKPNNYYGINIESVNSFWSSPQENEEDIIKDNTEWVAEVIWQDIPERAINFCDAKGNVVTSDTYDGKGTSPLYIKAANNVKGNVVVGIKQKGSSDYLWSWHLWLTEEPKEIASFMDRNLGATSAAPSDGAKTYGLSYQFGRKDPFPIDRNSLYDINGRQLQSVISTEAGKHSMSYMISNPTVVAGGITIDYNEQQWDDFTPCPKGWKVPEKSAFITMCGANPTWNSTYKGITYNGNWFPAVSATHEADGQYWSSKSLGGDYNDEISILSFTSIWVAYDESMGRPALLPVRCIKK